jgi:murein DD-endopeptidase MepM/ murein hydrolase activator NlpD
MMQRGLQTFKMKNVGGEEGFEIEDVNEVSSFYAQYLKELETAISKVPMGRPHNGAITSNFGTRENPFSGYGAETHPGIDFKGNMGDAVKSTANGKVSMAGYNGGYGNCIVIDHGYELQTLYGHLSKINVKIGDEVKLGEVIGEVGSTGRSTGPHLHYEVHFKGEKVNPELYLNFK